MVMIMMIKAKRKAEAFNVQLFHKMYSSQLLLLLISASYIEDRSPPAYGSPSFQTIATQSEWPEMGTTN